MEFLDVIDGEDRVVGHASREAIYRERLLHRIVHVMAVNGRGEIALQMRSPSVTFCPGHWCTSAGGHVRSCESYEEAAAREFQEELGGSGSLERLSLDWYEGDGIRKRLATFRVLWDGPGVLNPREVSRLDFFRPEQILQRVRAGEPFHPELLFLLEQPFWKRRFG